MNIILGTAQFGQSYGIKDKFKSIDEEEASKLIETAKKNKIKIFDTSPEYGKSYTYLNQNKFKDLKIISKFPKIKSSSNFGRAFDEFIEDLSKNFKISEIYCILFHDISILKTENGKKIWQIFLELKKQDFVKKIGFSIYGPDDLDLIFNKFRPDIIQGPFNIFDRRIEKTGWLDKLHKEGVHFHARSIFLQGLLLMDENNMPKAFRNWSKNFNAWHHWLKENKLKPIEGCIGLVNKDERISKVVVGIKSNEQFAELINLWKKIRSVPPEFLASGDENLINPSLW